MTINLANTWGTFDTLPLAATSGTFSVVTRNSVPVLRVNPTAGTGWALNRGLTSDGSGALLAKTTEYFAFPFEIASNPSAICEVCTVTNSSGQNIAILYCQTNGTLVLKYINGSDVATVIGSAATPPAGVFTVELGLVAIGTAGGATVELRINGVVQATASSLTVRSSGRTVDQMYTGNFSAATADFYYGIVVGDDAAYPGLCATQVLVPNSDVTANWVAGTGTTFAEVDEVDGSHANDGDTHYYASTTVDQIATHGLNDTSGTLDSIKAVVPFNIVRVTGADCGTRIRVISGATTLDSSTDLHSTSYVYRASILAVDPNTSAAWTQSAVDALKVGIVNRTAAVTRCTAVGAFVIYRLNQTLSPPEATATAQGEVPAIGATLPAVAATATTQAEVPVLNATLAAVAATATAQAEVPTIIDQASIAPPEATATAQAETPTMTASWTAVEATATAQGEVPVLNATLAAVEATATAQAEVPRIEAGAAFGVGPFIGSASKAMLSIGKATRSILARGTATAFRPARGSARIRRPGDLP